MRLVLVGLAVVRGELLRRDLERGVERGVEGLARMIGEARRVRQRSTSSSS